MIKVCNCREEALNVSFLPTRNHRAVERTVPRRVRAHSLDPQLAGPQRHGSVHRDRHCASRGDSRDLRRLQSTARRRRRPQLQRRLLYVIDNAKEPFRPIRPLNL